MAITIQLPSSIENQLRREVPNLDQVAREQFLISSYQAGRLTTADIAQALGLSTRQEAHEWLKHHGIALNYSSSDLQQDRKNMEQLFGKE
jgi:predicted HTH domain antitoxin